MGAVARRSGADERQPGFAALADRARRRRRHLPKDAALSRLVGTLLTEQNDEYAIQNRYMSLESLATISENPPIWLPAAPALA
ncbi:MAG: hypothetical protein IPH55_11745 [Betaproteobacteria bacterium]|nr:hypothetical protein [Betaproteobacteria bacterium]